MQIFDLVAGRSMLHYIGQINLISGRANVLEKVIDHMSGRTYERTTNPLFLLTGSLTDRD
jgi:hypothetical protein